MIHLIFLGPPGSGKGTQAEFIASCYNIPHISTGEILRQNVADKTELGIKAKSYMDAGELVPDQVLLSMVKDRLSQPDTNSGWLLDGFPRSVPQVYFLDELLVSGQSSLKVINFEVPEDVLVERLLGRGRKDDNEETIRRRLEVYNEQTAPLINLYSDRHQLISIDGNQSVENVTANLKAAI